MGRQRIEIATPEPWIDPRGFESTCYYVPWYRTERFRNAVSWEALKELGSAACRQDPWHLNEVDSQPPARPKPSIRSAPERIKGKVAKDASISWFSRAPTSTSDTEALYLAFLFVCESPMLPSEQKEWADLVETVFNQGDKMEAPADWKPDKNGRILKPMLDAYWMPGRSKEDYDTIGKAIQSWDGEGQKDNLRKDRLRQHQQYFSGTKQKKAGALTARICSCLGAVARLVKRGALLRRALDQARDCEEPPSVQQRFDLAQEELKQVKVELGEREKELLHTTTAAKRVEDAHRKLKERGRQQREQAALKAKESVKSHKAKLKAQHAERIKEARARLAEDARVKAQKEVSAQAEELKRRLAMARARARQTEAAIANRKKRMEELWKKLQPQIQPGKFGCVQVRELWSTEEDRHYRPGHHWLFEFGDAGNGTSVEKDYCDLPHRAWQVYKGLRFYRGDQAITVRRWLHRVDADTSGLLFEDWEPSKETLDPNAQPAYMIINSSELRGVAALGTGIRSELRQLLPAPLQAVASRLLVSSHTRRGVRDRAAAAQEIKRSFVLRQDVDNEWRSRCE